GLLGRLMPEFARVTFLVQHDFYHRYTVDEHTLTAIDALDRVALASGDPALERFRRVFEEVQQPGVLYLGLLLHDIGKGPGSGNEWQGSLLWDLYTRTRALLTEPDPAAGEGRSADARERAARQLQEEFAPSEVERHFALMPERYVRATDGADMVRHFRLLQALGERALAADWRSE